MTKSTRNAKATAPTSVAPLSPEALTPGKTPVPRVGALEQSVHDLGRQAQATGRVAARALLFGDVLATCGECHQWLGGGPDGGPR